MTWQTLFLFFVSAFFVSAAPGANMLFAFQMGLNHGLKKTLWVLAGLSFGLLILLLLALWGLGIIAKYPLILIAIKLFGAVYLAYLGVLSWHDEGKFAGGEQTVVPSYVKLFQSGVWVSLSNPKAILFFAAFFPKFIQFNTPLLPQYLWLIGAFFVSETIWQLIYTTGGVRLSLWLNAGKRMLYLNRACGLIFIGIGVALVWEVMGEWF